VLHVVLFGQVLGGVPVNDMPAEAYPSAWSLDPHSRGGENRVHRSTFQALWMANAARRANQKGAAPVFVADPDHPFLYIPDGPDGPVELGVSLPRVDSPADGLALAKRLTEEGR
jgi:hypothetical protein